jgi:hypothetical protein
MLLRPRPACFLASGWDGRNLFVVAVGHEFAGHEKSVVVSRTDRFAVIEIDVG